MNTAVVRPGEFGDVDSIAKIHVSTWQDAYKNIVPQNFLNNLSITKRADQWREAIKFDQAKGKSSLFVIVDNGKMCGFVSSGAPRDKDFSGFGEIYAIYVLPECQKHGYGQKLFQKARAFLVQQGYKQAYVWSLEKNNAAHKAYEKWGAIKAPQHSKKVEIENVELTEIAHIWKL